ncbi:uncharacterized protein LOC102710348 [Oryza brachyantha]|uniref:uncharacterized protein LOC102710348 n=1 Tax=Oryza brachyantha TaxID=4533 RepID=UPI0007765740|nr:uncharacterized protein LOC102710348 [Oryza brachyantha]
MAPTISLPSSGSLNLSCPHDKGCATSAYRPELVASSWCSYPFSYAISLWRSLVPRATADFVCFTTIATHAEFICMFSPYSCQTDINTQHVQLNPEERGVESRPCGGFVNLINAPSNHTNHHAEGSPTQPINIENGDIARTEKRLSWMNDEDLRLISAWLNNSNDPIESNFKKNDVTPRNSLHEFLNLIVY